jgi:hypothetical protein
VPYVETRGGSIRVKWWGGEYAEGPDGKRKKRYESASGPEPGVKFQTDGEAYNYGLDREYDVRHGKHIRRIDAMTLMETYCWTWFETLDLRHKSTTDYRSILNAVVVPYWKGWAVSDISAVEYDAWKKTVAARYSENYTAQILGLFGRLMADAVVKYKLRTESPVIEQRRRGRYKKKRREKKRPLRMEVLHQLASNAYTVWGYAGWTYIWTLAFTGMRPPGEMFGLRREFASPNWPASDPDPDRREEGLERYGSMPALRVQWQHQWVHGEKTLVDPKYDSHRTLVVPPFLHEMHAVLLASHASPWVFPSLQGGPLLGTDFQAVYWHPIRDGAEERTHPRFARPKMSAVEAMAGKRIYLLRHGHKEWLDEDGHPRVAVEARMGHELAGVEGVYSNLTPGMEVRIVETLQERWERFWGQAGDLWQPPFPTPLPDGHLSGDA